MFLHSDILWVKNVLNDHGKLPAYSEVSFGAPFYLHWSDRFKANATKANIGEIILLFQRPRMVNGRSNSLVHLTHLVTPIDSTVYRDPGNGGFSYCRLVEAIAISNPLYAVPNPGFLNFFKPNRGQTHSIANLEDKRPGITLEDTQKVIFSLFVGHFHTYISQGLSGDDVNGNYDGVIEGQRLIRKHIEIERAERNSAIARLAKYIALQRGNGHIKCECCQFDFREYYGDLGLEYIECHHKDFLSNGVRVTRVEDLSLVCSNCHRMLHRRDSSGNFNNVQELREIINKERDRINLIKII